MKKYFLIGAVIILAVITIRLDKNHELSTSLFHSSVFNMNEELMEVITQCPFEEKEKCHISVEDCTFLIDPATQEISLEDLKKCNLKIKTIDEENCEGATCPQ